MSTTEFLVGRTRASSFKFVGETENGVGLGCVMIAIEPREWDVSDPDAREVVARELLGDDFDHYRVNRSAQWWIDADRNAAGLAVYRPRRDGKGATR